MTSAAECMRPHMNEIIDFISDLHIINKYVYENVYDHIDKLLDCDS